MKFDSNVIKSTAAAPRWQDLIKKYQTPEIWRSVWQIATSILPYIALWVLMYQSLSVSYWLTLLLAVPAAGFVMRTFIIQHDCGHGSFFKSSRANELVGTFCGFLTMVAYHQWQHEHAVHHATSGDLSRRGVGDITTLTVKEYLALSPWGRFQYRFYRNPLVLLLIGPFYTFVIIPRFARKDSRPRARKNIHLTNLALLAIYGSLCLTIGVKAVLMIWLPVTMMSGAIGIWLFYVQHQYEDTYWRGGEEWDYVTSAVMGSSFYKLPRILQWFSGNIGFHHIHHLSPKIPNYKLQACHEATPLFQEAKVLSLRESLKSSSMRLWDEEQKRMVGFGELKQEYGVQEKNLASS
jgi:omega-6 fatty acid desaturase (delta-12 desaturase)